MADEPVVLVIDDEEKFGVIVREILEKHGYRVFNGFTALGAVALLETFKPDLILLDVMMPEIDGLTFLRAMRKDPEFSETKVIVISAKVTSEDKSAAMEAGADAFLEKPVTTEELLMKVRAVLGAVADE